MFVSLVKLEKQNTKPKVRVQVELETASVPLISPVKLSNVLAL